MRAAGGGMNVDELARPANRATDPVRECLNRIHSPAETEILIYASAIRTRTKSPHFNHLNFSNRL
jgi:hypothetical protein